MQSIDFLNFKPSDEIKEFVVKGSKLLSAEYERGLICVYYMYDDTNVNNDEDGTPITFYCIQTYQQLPDTFPGQFFCTVHDKDQPYDEREPLHLFFKLPRKENVQRGKPVVAERNPNDDGAAEHRDGGGTPKAHKGKNNAKT